MPQVFRIQDLGMDKLIDMIMGKLLSGGFVKDDEADIVRFGLELNIRWSLWRYIRPCVHAAADTMQAHELPVLYCLWL